MIQNIIYFIVTTVVIFLVAKAVISLITGRMYIRVRRFVYPNANTYMWGDRSVRPGTLVGLRARLLSLVILLLYTFFIFMILVSSDGEISLYSNKLISDSVSITYIIALLVGGGWAIYDFKKSQKDFINPEDDINIHTK